MEREKGGWSHSGSMEMPAGECLDTGGGMMEHGQST
jgi:hypothetical protein